MQRMILHKDTKMIKIHLYVKKKKMKISMIFFMRSCVGRKKNRLHFHVSFFRLYIIFITRKKSMQLDVTDEP